MNDTRLHTNARITVETACGVKAGESVLILTEPRNKPPYGDDLLPVVDALAAACVEIGARPAVLDIGRFVHSQAFDDGAVLTPVAAAMEETDVMINAVDYVHFSRLVGESTNEAGAWKSDKYITAAKRWFALQSHKMDQWDITAKQVAMINKRTDWLMEVIPKSHLLHITSPAGTDFSVGLDGAKANPFRALVPLYGEVALVPQFGTESGTLIFDGPTQRNVRPADQLDREPLRIEVADGIVTDYAGEAEQLSRLRAFIEDASPRANHIDEVGILTTQIKANDECWWEDGTHHSDRVHVALGNNLARDGRVHGHAHMDGEIVRPTIRVDETVIVADGMFVDGNMG